MSKPIDLKANDTDDTDALQMARYMEAVQRCAQAVHVEMSRLGATHEQGSHMLQATLTNCNFQSLTDLLVGSGVIKAVDLREAMIEGVIKEAMASEARTRKARIII